MRQVTSTSDTSTQRVGSPDPGQVTLLLERWSAGDLAVFDQLAPLVYDDMRRIARQRLRREAAGHTMNTSDLVHEAWLRLQRAGALELTHRGHFLAFCSRLMRQILTDYARARLRVKRGQGQGCEALSESDGGVEARVEEILTVSTSLGRLLAQHPRKAKVFEMRYFGGFEVHETAEALAVSRNTVVRDFEFACAWLRRELSGIQNP